MHELDCRNIIIIKKMAIANKCRVLFLKIKKGQMYDCTTYIYDASHES